MCNCCTSTCMQFVQVSNRLFPQLHFHSFIHAIYRITEIDLHKHSCEWWQLLMQKIKHCAIEHFWVATLLWMEFQYYGRQTLAKLYLFCDDHTVPITHNSQCNKLEYRWWAKHCSLTLVGGTYTLFSEQLNLFQSFPKFSAWTVFGHLRSISTDIGDTINNNIQQKRLICSVVYKYVLCCVIGLKKVYLHKTVAK